MDTASCNRDCRNYAPVDVVKGVCHATKDIVPADGAACARFEKAPRCKFCGRFTPGSAEYKGICEASPARPMTYPDLSGVACEFFEWKKQA